MRTTSDMPERITSWRENPVADYSRPGRRSVLHRWLLRVLVLMHAGLVPWMIQLTKQPSAAGLPPGAVVLDLMLYCGLLNVFAVPVLFHLYVRDLRQADTLEQLYLSGMEPRLVAKGALIWGIVAALLMPVLQTCVFIAGTFAMPWEFKSNFGGYEMVGNRWMFVPHRLSASLDAIRALAASLVLILLPSVVALVRCVRGWLVLRFASWRVCLTAPLWGILAGGLAILAIHVFCEETNPRWFNRGTPVSFSARLLLWGVEHPFATSYFGLVMLGAAAITGWQAIASRAGAYYFRSLDEEFLRRADWLERERAAREPLRRRKALRPHSWLALRAIIPNFLLATIGIFVAINLLGFMLRGIGIGPLFKDFPYLIVLLGLLSVVVVVARREWSSTPEFPVVSGGLVTSVLGWYLPFVPAILLGVTFIGYFSDSAEGSHSPAGLWAPALAFGIYYLLRTMGISPLWKKVLTVLLGLLGLSYLVTLFFPMLNLRPFLPVGIIGLLLHAIFASLPGLFLFCIIAAFLLCYLLTIVLISRRMRRGILYTVSATVGVALFLVLAFQAPWMTTVMGWVCFTICIALLQSTIACLPSLLFQRLHEETVLYHPAGMMSTEPPPAMMNEVVPTD